MGKIQNKIIIMFMLVTIVPIIIVSVYFSLHITKFLKQDNLSELKRDTEIKVGKASDMIRSIENDINSLAVNVSLVNFIDAVEEENTEYVTECKHNLELILKGFSEKKGIYDKICYVNESGIETVQVVLTSKGDSTIVPFNKQKDIISSIYFNEALKLKEGKVFVSESDMVREEGRVVSKSKPVLRYATPVFDRRKRKSGVLVFNVSASYLQENISGFNTIDGVESNLLDKNGNYLLHSNKSKSNPLSNIKSTFNEDVASIVLSGNSGIKMVDNVLLSFIPIKYDSLDSGRYWVYLDSLNLSKVYSKIYTIYKIIGALAFLLMTGLVVSNILFSKKITEPLDELVKGATAVSKGDLDYHIKSESNDELKFVIFSFNKMVASLSKARKQLQNYVHNLEQKIADKTIVINEKLKKSEILVEAGRLLSEQEDINKSMDSIVDLITRTLDINFCAILQLDNASNLLLMVNGIGWKEGVVGNVKIDVGMDFQMSSVLGELKPVVIKNLEKESYFSETPFLVEHKIVSGVSVPMTAGEHITGVLGVYSDQFKEFSNDDINFLLSVGYIIASAIEGGRADREIENQSVYTKNLIETSQDAIICIDNNGFINIWNKSAEKIFGYSEDDIIGHPISQIMPDRYKEQYEGRLMKFLKTGKLQVAEKTLEAFGINKIGMEIPIELSLTFQEIEKEKILCTVKVRDLTDRRRAVGSFKQKLIP